jgi:RimJ/RimL family protein N-acetyltransferase
MTTKHFIIRELSVEDIDDLYRICQEPEINQFIDSYQEDLKTEKEKLAAYIDNIYRFYGFGLWGVYFKSNGSLVGQCGVELKQLAGKDIYEISYLLDKAYQGHGYALEIVTGVIDFCIRVLKFSRITAVIDKNNKRSTHLAEKVGMVKYGECIRGKRSCNIYEI